MLEIIGLLCQIPPSLTAHRHQESKSKLLLVSTLTRSLMTIVAHVKTTQTIVELFRICAMAQITAVMALTQQRSAASAVEAPTTKICSSQVKLSSTGRHILPLDQLKPVELSKMNGT